MTDPTPAPADAIRAAIAILREPRQTAVTPAAVALAVADWLEADLLAHEQGGALAAAAMSGELDIGGDLLQMTVGISALDKALAVARAVTAQEGTT